MGLIKITITLEQQIILTEGRISVRKQHDSDLPLDDSILSSLRRLQAIEQQEPVGVFQYESWRIAFTYKSVPDGAKLYAIPVSPAIPEGFRLVPIEPTVKMLDACLVDGATEAQRKVKNVYADIWAKMLAAAEVSHD